MSYLSFYRPAYRRTFHVTCVVTVKLFALLLLVTQIGSIVHAAEEIEIVSAADR